MKIRPVGAQLFHAEGRTDGTDEANSRFFNFANAPKKKIQHVAGSERAWVTWQADAVLPRHSGVKLAKKKKKALVSTKCDVCVGCESRNIYLGGRFQETSVAAASPMPTNVSSIILWLFMALF